MAGNSRVSDQTCPTLELLSVRTISTVTAPATPAAKPLRPIGTPFCRHLPAASVFQPVIGPSQIVRVRLMVTFRNWLLHVNVIHSPCVRSGGASRRNSRPKAAVQFGHSGNREVFVTRSARNSPSAGLASIRKPCHVVKRRFVSEIRPGPIPANALRSSLPRAGLKL